MPQSAASLRNEAARCEAHAILLTDRETRAELLKLAAEYFERAALAERKE